MSDDLTGLLVTRFGTDFSMPDDLPPDAAAALADLAGHTSLRRFADRPVSDDLVRLLCAIALSAPSKSDLQLRDIIRLRDPARRQALAELVPGTSMITEAPVLLVVCGNAGRLTGLMEQSGTAFPNAHADLLVNAVADAAMVLGWLQAATDLAGLGGCAISGIRERIDAVAALLDLPPLVVPLAGFALGWPESDAARPITPRLPLALTLHDETLPPADDPAVLAAYDAARGAPARPGWTDRRIRQYAQPMRAGNGAFLRKAGFNLD